MLILMTVLAYVDVINKFRINNPHDTFGSRQVNFRATNFAVLCTQREMGVSAGLTGRKGVSFI